MSEHHDPPRLRDDEELRGFLESTELDDDRQMVPRIGMALGLAPATPTLPPSAGDMVQAGASGWASTWSVWKALLLSMFVGLGLLVAWSWANPSTTPGLRGPEPIEAGEGTLERLQHPAGITHAPRELVVLPAAEPIPSPQAESAVRTNTTPVIRSAPAIGARRAPRETITSDVPPEIEEAQSPSAADSNGSLAAEIRLIERIRTTLVTDPEGALQLAEDHRAQFPDGRLQTERDRLERRARTLTAER